MRRAFLKALLAAPLGLVLPRKSWRRKTRAEVLLAWERQRTKLLLHGRNYGMSRDKMRAVLAKSTQ